MNTDAVFQAFFYVPFSLKLWFDLQKNDSDRRQLSGLFIVANQWIKNY